VSAVFPTAVYTLCFLTSALCALLLGRSYLKVRARLVLWSSLSFAFLAANNLVVVIDLVLLPDIDLRLLRHAFSIGGILALLWGFIWNEEN
jgi:hypothetical protein